MAQREFKHRILIVDDDEALLAATSEVFSREGYAVETAYDGFEALAVLRDITPDVIISDLKMPNMSGFELLAVVRKRFPGIGVIARSAEFSPLAMPEGVLADKYVRKGDNDNFELLEAVRELLSESPLRAQPAKPSLAPAWLPRSSAGYIVITCPGCLRSFSRMRRQLKAGVLVQDTCIHCGAEVSYRVDATVAADVEDTYSDQVKQSRRMIDSSLKMISDSKKLIR